jgi:signal transduction histidine kinase
MSESDMRPRQDQAAPTAEARAGNGPRALLAHEFRTPLAAALQALEVLRTVPRDDPAAPRALDLIERQLRYMSRLADDTLDLSRALLRKLELRRERVDLSRLVQVVAADRRAALERAGLVFTVQTTEEPMWVTGDATRLAQVLHNLLDNAAKFTDAGGRVTVRVVAVADRQRAAVVVSDTGDGIESDLLPRVFDLFVQGDRARHRTRGGLGLGLALVKALVEWHGGDVTAASAGAGRGAEFVIRLPLAEALEGRPEPPEIPPPDRGGVCLFTLRSQGRRR